MIRTLVFLVATTAVALPFGNSSEPQFDPVKAEQKCNSEITPEMINAAAQTKIINNKSKSQLFVETRKQLIESCVQKAKNKN